MRKPTPCFSPILLVLLLAACGPDEDLSRALDGGVGREISAPGAPELRLAWTDVARAGRGNDTLVQMPRALCWRGGDLLVADGARERVEVFDASGRHQGGFGRPGQGPGEFRRLAGVACSADGRTVLTVDPGTMRVSVFDSAGSYVRAYEAPPTPQGLPYLGEFAIADDGTWFDSWLGARVGPYLADAEWDSVKVVRSWTANGTQAGAFGDAFHYRNTVLRRVLNQPDLAFHRDTLWVLSRGNAAIRAFRKDGSPAGEPVFLPVYHRGAEPVVELGSSIGSFRRNRAAYQPNVSGLAVVADSLFAVLRFRDWRTVDVERREGEGFKDYWATSSVEVIDRAGRVVATIPVPGRAKDVEADRLQRLAVLTEDLDTGVESVLVAQLPALRAPGQ